MKPHLVLLPLAVPAQIESVECGDRTLSLRRDADTMAPLATLGEVDDRGLRIRVSPSHSTMYGCTYVFGDPVVPEDDGIGCPLHASLIIATLVDVVVQQSEDGLCDEGQTA